MPISEDEWEQASERSDRSPENATTAVKADVAAFLNDHADQGFTLMEVTENVEAPVEDPSGRASGLRQRLKGFVVSTGKKQFVKYVLNQLVAEGHVETRVSTESGTETVYYRAATASE
jgi:hypothetical protein